MKYIKVEGAFCFMGGKERSHFVVPIFEIFVPMNLGLGNGDYCFVSGPMIGELFLAYIY